MCSYIGIDYSSTSPAICVLRDDFKTSLFFYATYNQKLAEKALNYDGFLLTEGLKDIQRYYEIAKWAISIIKPYIKENIKIAMEGYSFGSSRSLTFNIAENAGLLKFLLFKELNIMPTIIPQRLPKSISVAVGERTKRI